MSIGDDLKEAAWSRDRDEEAVSLKADLARLTEERDEARKLAGSFGGLHARGEQAYDAEHAARLAAEEECARLRGLANEATSIAMGMAALWPSLPTRDRDATEATLAGLRGRIASTFDAERAFRLAGEAALARDTEGGK